MRIHLADTCAQYEESNRGHQISPLVLPSGKSGFVSPIPGHFVQTRHSNNWCGVVCIVQREILSICIGRITVVSSKHRSHHTPRKEDAISDSLADAVAATSIQTIIEWYLVSTDDIRSRCAELVGLCTGIRRELQTHGTLHVEGSSKSYMGHPGFPRHQTDRRVKQLWIESVTVWKVGIMKQQLKK